MYLSKVILENFQAFKYGEFALSPNLNLIVGISNQGKSSVARALSLLLFNKWDKSWVRFGAKHCKVTVETDTGIQVLREKGDKVNKYTLIIPNQPPQVFESFGTGVPDDIKQALGIYEVPVDTTDILNLNLAGQMDPLFLLTNTGSYKAKVLGKLSGATYLDHAIRSLNNDKRQHTAEKTVKEQELVELQAQLEKIKPIEAYSNKIAEIEQRIASFDAVEHRLGRIRILLGRVKAFKTAWTSEVAKEALLERFNHKNVESSINSIKNLINLRNRANSIIRSKEKTTKILSLLTLSDSSVKIDMLVNFGKRIATIAKLKNSLKANNAAIQDNVLKQNDINNQCNECESSRTSMLKSCGVCPTCNQSTMELV